MKKLIALSTFLLLILSASVAAQSLKPEEPYPLQAGINKGTSDSLVGTHYWYFYATPGSNRVNVRFKPMGLYGASVDTTLTITLSDEKKTWHNTKLITSRNPETNFTAEKLVNTVKIIISIAPPKNNLIRTGGDYEIEATGDVRFDAVKKTGDPIVRTYDSKVNDYGATRFLADGTIETASGAKGTWKTFDPDNHIYTVVISGERFSVQYLAGYGLVKPSDPGIILFQELRR